MFVYNIESGEFIYLDGFFVIFVVNFRVINNNGIIVGEGEYDVSV